MTEEGHWNDLTVEWDDTIAVITLARPTAANTFTASMVREFEDAVVSVTRKHARVLVVTGAGKHFCAGADLKAVANGTGPRLGDTRFIDQLEDARIPVIAALNGSAVGGGCELALACDLRIMAATATIGLPEVRFGGLPAGGGTQRLPRLIGAARAKEMLFTGEPLDAEEALAIGLVNRVTAQDRVLDASLQIARLLASRAEYALESLKMLVNRGMNMDLRSGLALENYVARKMATPEQRREAQRAAGSGDSTYRRIFEE